MSKTARPVLKNTRTAILQVTNTFSRIEKWRVMNILESINGKWTTDNSQGNIKVKDEKITFMKNFYGNIDFEVSIYI